MQSVGAVIAQTFVAALNSIILFIPRLLAAIVILLVGWLIAAILKSVTNKLLDAVDLDGWLQKAGVEKRGDRKMWSRTLSLIVFWTIIFFFLVPAIDSLDVPRVTVVLNQLLYYIPNVFAAVIMGIIGLIFANLSFQVVTDAAGGFGRKTVVLLANLAKYAILVFTGLIVLNQLGIATSLIQILFTGFVFMLTLGGGLAIGLGGQDAVRNLLSQYLSQKPKNISSQTMVGARKK